MIQIVDPIALGSTPYIMPGCSCSGPKPAGSCAPGGRCDAYRPDPQPSGNLQVDPDILLPSPGMNVDLAMYYNSSTVPGSAFANGPYGLGRTMSCGANASLLSGSSILIERGNGALATYTSTLGSGWTPGTPGVLNTLVVSALAETIAETTPDGVTTVYPLKSGGAPQTLTYVQDSVGNIHSYIYSSGLLQNIQDGSGRLVTFLYSGGLLQTIEDWAGRRTTFAYDTVSASPSNLLTTVTGPTGCQTQYQYTELVLSKSNAWLLTGIVDPNGWGTSYT